MARVDVIVVTVVTPKSDEVQNMVFGRLEPVEARQVLNAMEEDFVRLCQDNHHRYDTKRGADDEWLTMNNLTMQITINANRMKIEHYESGAFDFLFD